MIINNGESDPTLFLPPSVGKQLIVSGNKEYAVSCYMSASQCEEQLGNTVGETNALTKAASLFLEVTLLTTTPGGPVYYLSTICIISLTLLLIPLTKTTQVV